MSPIIKFTGENYFLWLEDAKIKLLENNLIQAATAGSSLKTNAPTVTTRSQAEVPPAPQVSTDEALINARAKFKILESIPFHLRRPEWAEPSTLAFEIWNTLANKYGTLNAEAIGQLRREFALTQWRNQQELPNLINKLERIKYQSTFADEKDHISEKELCVQLTLYYPQSWETKMTTIRADPDTQYDWSKLKTSLLREFRVRNTNQKNVEKPSTQKKGYNSYNEKQHKNSCDHCLAANRTKLVHTHATKDCRFMQSSNKTKPNDTKNVKGTIGKIANQSIDQLIIDTGASHHTTGNINFLYEVHDASYEGKLPYGSTVIANKCGKMDLNLMDGTIGTLENVYYNPIFHGTLISSPMMHKAGCSIQSDEDSLIIRDKERNVVIRGILTNGLYVANVVPVIYSNINFNQTTAKCSLNRLHQRLGHVNESVLRSVPNNTTQISFTGKLSDHCEICSVTKSHHLPYHQRDDEISIHPVGRLDFDMSGPHNPISITGHRFYVSAILQNSKFCFVTAMKTKSQAPQFIKTVTNWIFNRKNSYPSEFRSDNAPEFIKLQEYAGEHGIQYSLATPGAHNQNPNAERSIRTINEMASAILRDANMSNDYWSYAVEHVAYIRNRIPVAKLGYKTPYETLLGTKPTLKYLRRFGCRCYVLNPTNSTPKIGQKSTVARYLGNTSTAYIVELPDSRVIFSRDVTFNEEFPETNLTATPTLPFYDNDQSGDYSESDIINKTPEANFADESSDDEDNQSLYSDSSESNDEIFKIPELEQSNNILGRINMVLNTLETDTDDLDIPVSINEAIQKPQWKNALIAEINGLLQSNCLIPQFKAPSTRPITVKCIFTKKPSSSGIKYKARIVARGFLQKYGIDYFDTYAGVASTNSIRLIVALHACFGGELKHRDIKQAFLNGILKEEVFIKVKIDLNDMIKAINEKVYNPEGIYRLNKSLYGLKQAGNVWSEKLNEILSRAGFQRSITDPYFYHKTTNESKEFVVTYVDDIISLSINSQTDWTSEFKKENILINEVSLNDKLIGFEINLNEKSIQLSQTEYISYKANSFSLENAKYQSAPNIENLPGTFDAIDKLPYQKLMGSLQYAATCSRPDVAFVVAYMSRFNQKYGYSHFKASKTILKYLNSTKTKRITYERNSPPTDLLEIEAYSDSDFASSKDMSDKRRSVSGFLIMIQGGPIMWGSKRQTITASSAYEAELIAIHLCVKNILSLTNLLTELNINVKKPIVIKVDNQAAIKTLNGPVVNNDSKSLSVKIFSVKDHIKSGLINLKYVNTKDNVADMLTKSLDGVKLKKLTNLMNLK